MEGGLEPLRGCTALALLFLDHNHHLVKDEDSAHLEKQCQRIPNLVDVYDKTAFLLLFLCIHELVCFIIACCLRIALRNDKRALRTSLFPRSLPTSPNLAQPLNLYLQLCPTLPNLYTNRTS